MSLRRRRARDVVRTGLSQPIHRERGSGEVVDDAPRSEPARERDAQRVEVRPTLGGAPAKALRDNLREREVDSGYAEERRCLALRHLEERLTEARGAEWQAPREGFVEH